LAQAEVQAVLQALRAYPSGAPDAQLKADTRLTQSKLNRALHRLEDQGVVERAVDGAFQLNQAALPNLPERVDAALDAHAALRQRQASRIEEMQAYSRARGCRRALLLWHFGEELTACSGCDNCDAPLQGAAA